MAFKNIYKRVPNFLSHLSHKQNIIYQTETIDTKTPELQIILIKLVFNLKNLHEDDSLQCYLSNLYYLQLFVKPFNNNYNSTTTRKRNY